MPRSPNKQISSRGKGFACALHTNGTLTCYGLNTSGPTNVPPGETFTGVTTGHVFGCAVRTDGVLRCWGDNGFGQTNARAGTGWVNVEASSSQACALRDTGDVTCWGSAPAPLQLCLEGPDLDGDGFCDGPGFKGPGRSDPYVR